MQAHSTSIKQSALGWVKKAIDENLSEIETDLKQFIEDRPDAALLHSVKERLDVIKGALMMIEQYGAAMLTEEMIALADFIVEQKQEQREQALVVMLRAVLQLPDYLEHIQSGNRDIPIAILPLLNDIRAVRNQDLFSEKLLFLPDLSMHQDGADVETIDEKQNQASKLLAKKVRPIYQHALLNVIRDKSLPESLARLEKVCETLEERACSEQVARIWWIVGALVESVRRDQLKLGVSVKNLLGKVDALFRVILIIGERGLAKRQPIELIKNFLFYLAQPECDGPKTQAIKTAYRLEEFLPSESARSEVLENIAGPNQALLKTVAETMKADIEAVKSTLEVYVNGDLSNVEILKDLPAEMHIISDTLAMIGLGSQRQLIEQQIATVKDIVTGNLSVYEERLLSMAAELIQVEHALDQMQKRPSARVEKPRSDADVSRDYELDNVLAAVVSAALDDLQKTKSAILDFIKDPSRSENIELCVTLMHESRGALELLNQPRAVAVIDGLLKYLRGYDIGEFMDAKLLDALSQVVVSLEYYLEALGERRSDADDILDFADARLRELLDSVKGRETVAAETAVTPATADAAESAAAADATLTDATLTDITRQAAGEAEPQTGPTATVPEPEPEAAPKESPEDHAATVTGLMVHELHGPGPDQKTQESASAKPEPEPPAAPPAQPPAQAPVEKIKVDPVVEELEVLRPGSDPEILEIYLEEAEEEAHNIARLQQDWLLHPEDENALKNIRRAFHTIKGSGRLVGAIKIGEFAWEYEQLLNRVIDKTMRPGKTIVDAVGLAANTLPKLIRELKADEDSTVDIGYLRGLARALSQFNAEQVLIEHMQTMTIVESPYDRITDEGDGEEGEAAEPTVVMEESPQPQPLLEEIEPETMRVDAAMLQDPEAMGYSETLPPTQAVDAPEALDETVKMAPPEPPLEETVRMAPSTAQAEAEQSQDETPAPQTPDQYTRAPDYRPDRESWDAEHVDLEQTRSGDPSVTIAPDLVDHIDQGETPRTEDEDGLANDQELPLALLDLEDYESSSEGEAAADTPIDASAFTAEDESLFLLDREEEATGARDSAAAETPTETYPYSEMADPSVEIEAVDEADASISLPDPGFDADSAPTDSDAAPADPYAEMVDPSVEIEAVDEADASISLTDPGFDAASAPTDSDAAPADSYAEMADPSVEIEAVDELDASISLPDPGFDADSAPTDSDAAPADPYSEMADPSVEIEAVDEADASISLPDLGLDAASAPTDSDAAPADPYADMADPSVEIEVVEAGDEVPDLAKADEPDETAEAEESIEMKVVEEDFDTDISDEDLSADEFDAAVQEQADLDRTITEIKVEDVEEATIEGMVEESLQDDNVDPLSTLDEIEVEEVDEVEARAIDDEPSEDETSEAPHDPLVETTSSDLPGNAAEASASTPPGPSAAIGLSFDPELLTIYQQEVEQHLSTLSSALERAEQIQELVPDEDIYRALHTIHGASRTADIASIGELASLMEQPLKAAIAHNIALDYEIIALYREGQRALESMTRELVARRRMPKIPQELEVSLKALASDFDEPTVDMRNEDYQATSNIVETLTIMSASRDAEQDNELLAIFVDEANELLEMSDHTLHEWSRQKGDDSSGNDFSAVMELQRYLHTLKGGARMAELKEISDLAHEMESMFIAVIDGRVEKNEELLDLLKNCFDSLHQQVGEAEAGEPMTDAAGRVDQLRQLRRHGATDQIEHALEAESDIDSEDIDIVSEHLPDHSLAGADRSMQDVIKVRSDLLDNLVNSAGEVNIYRARMEQQVAGLGSYLSELGQTISRLKGQLRNLEAETDAQIHFSHRSEAKNTGDFDPLEMDRYTMIQELSRSLSESVNDLSSLQHMLGEQVKDSETLLLQQSRVSTDLQDGLIKSRMVKFSGLLSRLRRLVRQSSQELGKKAELLITGEENEVDNKVLDRMVAPLEHIIRNAVSHGIETPVERVKKGKPESGRIAIDISRDGSDIVILVSDDGAGVNIERVRRRATQLGLLEENADLTESDLVQLILEPGFSTAEHVTQLSGRGVGMDVVDIEVKQLGGTLQIETNPSGTTFIARLPFTLSINQAIMVRSGDETYAIPLINIEGITRLDNQSMAEYYRSENPQVDYAGQQFPLHHLAKLVGGSMNFRASADDEKQAVILSRAGDVRVALHVDEIIGNREIVVKSLGKQLSQVKGISGASILADGSVVLILDIAGLMRVGPGNQVRILYQAEETKTPRSRNIVMVVDDSITMRRVASKLLERHNFDVVTAKDGVDALAQLEEVQPDVMLLDIEMPRMDGFELATHMRNEETYSNIPIIMITSRTGEKHRHRAFEIGVTNYMGKPYQEEELIENIQSALRVAG